MTNAELDALDVLCKAAPPAPLVEERDELASELAEARLRIEKLEGRE